MTTFVLLQITDDAEAQALIQDIREYGQNSPLLTPVQENTVFVTRAYLVSVEAS